MVLSKFMIVVVVILIRFIYIELTLLFLEDLNTFLYCVFEGETIGFGQTERKKPRDESENRRRKP
jgi:hypothetical protein